MDATIKAGEERLRPIIMTSLAFILGVLPLAIATGAGANARHSIGTGIMGGMIGEATLAMLYVPLFFYLFDRLAERGKKEEPAPGEPEADVSTGGKNRGSGTASRKRQLFDKMAEMASFSPGDLRISCRCRPPSAPVDLSWRRDLNDTLSIRERVAHSTG